MIANAIALPSSGMAKKDNAPRTAQINFRLKEETIERMERFREAHPLRPSLTAMVEAAMKIWLDANEPDVFKERRR